MSENIENNINQEEEEVINQEENYFQCFQT